MQCLFVLRGSLGLLGWQLDSWRERMLVYEMCPESLAKVKCVCVFFKLQKINFKSLHLWLGDQVSSDFSSDFILSCCKDYICKSGLKELDRLQAHSGTVGFGPWDTFAPLQKQQLSSFQITIIWEYNCYSCCVQSHIFSENQDLIWRIGDHFHQFNTSVLTSDFLWSPSLFWQIVETVTKWPPPLFLWVIFK